VRTILTRRDFVAGVGKAAAVGIVAPFTFVRHAATRTDALRRFLVGKLTEANTPGIAVAVVRGDEVVWSAGVGWADKEHGILVTPETAFQLASVSKTVTCAGIMALVQDGMLDLDADINEYLPFAVHIPKTPTVPITMRMLLTHTSAIRDRYNVWGLPWSTPTLYFHGDSPISDLPRSLLPLVLRPGRQPVRAER
jgi:CubicO group peptidase (beta-lactamase class C family)